MLRTKFKCTVISVTTVICAIGLPTARAETASLNPIPSSPVPSAVTAPASAQPTGSPVTVGAVLKAVDKSGNPLVSARFDVYRADQPDGDQHPLLDLPSVSGGTTSVPLPAPSSIPDAASNYFAVASGLDASGNSVSGVEFFNLTEPDPLAKVLITPNLFDVPTVTVIGNPPPLPEVNPSPPPSGPCGYRPDAQNPPPPFFTIHTDSLGVQDGTINVGAAHGAGYWPGDSKQPGDLLGENYRAVGEELASEGARTTESSVVMALDTHGETQTKYNVVGNFHFTLSSSDTADYAGVTDRAEQAGFGARNLVVSATWLHQALRFHCNDGSFDEVYEVWTPHEWDPHIPYSTPDGFTYWDTREGLESQDAAVVYPYPSGLNQTYHTGHSQVYSNGYGAAAGAGPVGLDFSVESQSTWSVTHEVTIYSGEDCGTTEAPECYFWTMNVAGASDGDCPWQMACGSDYYTGVLSTSPTTPGSAPQPCSKYAPHGGSDC